MKKRQLFIVLVFVLVGIYFVLLSDSDGFKDNYYLSINKDVIDDNVLEDGEYSWSYFLEAQEEVDEDVYGLVDDILDGTSDILSDKEIRAIRGVYDKAIDMDKRNSDGIYDLKPYIDRVWSVSTVEELVSAIILVEKELGVSILSNIEVVQDYKDNSKNIIYFYPVTYAFGASSDYMVDLDYMTYKAYIRRACVQLWKAYGLEVIEAREVVDRVFSFYDDVSGVAMKGEELEDIGKYYNVVTEDEVNGIFSNVSGEYLARMGIGGKDYYSLVDKGQYQYLNDSLVVDNLNVWKEVIITKILSSYALYGGEDYVEVVDNLNEALMGEVEKDDEKRARELVKGLFSSEIDKVYAKRSFNARNVNEIEEMFIEIKRVFADRLRNNSWLSEEAKSKALVKLDKMDIIIGLDDETKTYEMARELDVSNGSLISDVIRLQMLAMENDLERLNSGEMLDLVDQTQVNAYYQPLDNSIVIPVAFFELVDEYDSYYEKLGTLGMIIAHEVTHAFDGNGSKFDENGNLNDWWSEEDKEVFRDLKDEVSEYYSQFEVLNGKYINGEKTVNENIADLGAVACIVDIAKEKDASDGDMKMMFSSFAKVWASREDEEYMELLLLQDVHSPNQFRVNAVLSSIEEFYQVYNIYPWNNMWISKDERVMVW